MRKLLTALACLVLACTFAGPVSAADDFKLGLMCPVTGKWASEGVDMKNVVSMLVDRTNAAGGIGGRKIELIIADDAGDPRSAALAAQKLASSEVVAVIGTYGSAVTEASQNIYDESEIVQISNGATSIRLTEKNLKYYFRTCPRDDAQGTAAADIIKAKGYKNIAILHDNSSYSKGLAEATIKSLEGSNVNIVFYDALTPGERDYTATLTKLKTANPEFVFFTGYYPETGMLLRQKKEMGWNVPMMGGDASNHADLVTIAGNAAAEGYFFISPPLPQDMDTDNARAFLTSYKEVYKTLPISVWGVIAGDAYMAIEEAMKAGNFTADKIADFLHGAKDLPGITGAMGFDAKGDRVGDFYRIYTVKADGSFVLEPKL